MIKSNFDSRKDSERSIKSPSRDILAFNSMNSDLKTLSAKNEHSNSHYILPKIKLAQKIKNASVLPETEKPNNNEYGLPIYPKSKEKYAT